jgi:hypothetical protein
MKDGTVRESIANTVIPNGDFYQVLNGITEKLRSQRVAQKG